MTKTRRTFRTMSMLTLATSMLLGCASNSSSESSNTKATLADYCAKCAACVNQPGFDEGFCTPFKTTGAFNRLGCEQKGDTTALKTPDLTKGNLESMSCQAFDDAE